MTHRDRAGDRRKPQAMRDIVKAFRIHPPGETGLARRDDSIALILIAESPKQVIKLVIYLGNPGLYVRPQNRSQ